MNFSLLQLSSADLEAIANSRIPERLESVAEPDSMPPAFVAARALALGEAGHPAPWSTTFLIVSAAESRIVGSCGFKTAPTDGRVEIGYGVSSRCRGKGAATAALNLLVLKAFESGATEVLAEVAPTNLPSTRVVQKAGFVAIGARVDHESEYLIQWAIRSGGDASV